MDMYKNLKGTRLKIGKSSAFIGSVFVIYLTHRLNEDEYS